MNEIKSTVGNMLKRCVGIHKRCKNTDLMTSLQIRDPLESIKLRKLKLYQRLMNNESTNEILLRENHDHQMNTSRNTFIKEIYEIVEIREKVETYELELIVCDKINELNSKYENDQNKPEIIELREHLDKYNLNAAEEMLTPNELRDWIDTAERETSERIRVINDIYEMQLDMAFMEDALENLNI